VLAFDCGDDPSGDVSAATENGAATTLACDRPGRIDRATGGVPADCSINACGDVTARTEGSASDALAHALASRPRHAPRSVDGVGRRCDPDGNLPGDGTHAWLGHSSADRPSTRRLDPLAPSARWPPPRVRSRGLTTTEVLPQHSSQTHTRTDFRRRSSASA
jgi:hypothetical protein